jgi:hypothetical protein
MHDVIRIQFDSQNIQRKTKNEMKWTSRRKSFLSLSFLFFVHEEEVSQVSISGRTSREDVKKRGHSPGRRTTTST